MTLPALSTTLRYFFGSYPWRALAYVVSGTLTGALAATLVLVFAGGGLVLLPILVGVFLLREIPAVTELFAEIERARARLVNRGQPTRRSLLRQEETLSMGEYLRTLRKPGPGWWRAAAYVLVCAVVWPAEAFGLTVAAVVGAASLAAPALVRHDDPVTFLGADVTTVSQAWLVALAGLGWTALMLFAVIPAWAWLRARLVTWLGPSVPSTARQIAELRASRYDLATAFDSERERIERMLHDGVQHRLVALTMTLGMAELQANGDTAKLVTQAHGQADAALADLRSAVHGIAPRVLADHGLAAALRDLAGHTPIQVTLELDVPADLHPMVADCSYFVAAEALSNSLKHGQASTAVIRAATVGDTSESRHWQLSVRDDGKGAAAIRPGGGLQALTARAAALGGALTVHSPSGGPTEVTLKCPLTPPR